MFFFFSLKKKKIDKNAYQYFNSVIPEILGFELKKSSCIIKHQICHSAFANTKLVPSLDFNPLDQYGCLSLQTLN